MSDCLIIGLMALKTTGKDYIVNLLQKESTKYDVVNIKFAKSVKDMVKDLFGFEPEDKTPLNRKALITMATAARKIDPNVWVAKTQEEISRLKQSIKKDTVFFVTDVRFQNEIEYLIQEKSILVDVSRKGVFETEKKIVEIFGANYLSRIICWFFGGKLAHESEWNYFRNRKLANAKMTYTSEKQAIEFLHHIINSSFSDVQKKYVSNP